MLSETDLTRIAAAVCAAEAETSGEVFCLFAEEVSHYPEVPLAYAAGAALVLPALAVAVGLYGRVADRLAGWSASQGVSDAGATVAALSGYAFCQAVVFGAVWALVAIPQVRRALTPGWLKAQRVKRLAEQLFVATGMKDDPTRTGILIFAAFAERRVELVADELIHAKAEPGAWDRAVKLITDGMRGKAAAEGFVQAIGLCGAALAAAFPGGQADGNRLADKPVHL